MALPEAKGATDRGATGGGPDALVADLESALRQEYDALLGCAPEALVSACNAKVAALHAIAAFGRADPASVERYWSRLRAAAVANARNQTLLSVLRARVERRVQALGLAGPVYDQTAQRRISVTGRSLSRG